MKLEKINIIGNGPAGLYFAILAKKSSPAAKVTLYERCASDDIKGWGIIINLGTVGLMRKFDPESHQAIVALARQWSRVDILYKWEKLSVQGRGYISLSRHALVKALRKRCAELGIDMVFGMNITDLAQVEDCDLLVGADGANSALRKIHGEHFHTTIDWRRNRFCWMGTTRVFETITHMIKHTPTGVFTADGYVYADGHSSFIPNIDEPTWHRSGFESMSMAEAAEYLAGVFEDELEGHPLLFDSASYWRQFPHITNGRWYYRNAVLIGDALRTAHFTIGSGTRLAIEDAIVLAQAMETSETVSAGLEKFEEMRRPLMERLQHIAFESMCWFENIEQQIDLDTIPFVYELMTRTSTLGKRSLRLMDPAFVRQYEEYQGKLPAKAD